MYLSRLQTIFVQFETVFFQIANSVCLNFIFIVREKSEILHTGTSIAGVKTTKLYTEFNRSDQIFSNEH